MTFSEKIVSNHIRDNITWSVDENESHLLFEYLPNPEWDTSFADVKFTVKLAYDDEETLHDDLNLALASVRRTFLAQVMDKTSITKIYCKNFKHVSYSYSHLKYDPTDKRSYICFGKYELSVDFNQPFRNIIGWKKITEAKPPLFAMAFATRHPRLVAFIRRAPKPVQVTETVTVGQV